LNDLAAIGEHNFLCQIGNENFNELSAYNENDNLKLAEVKIKSNIFVSNYMHAKIIAKNGKHITAMPEEYIRDELKTGKLVRILPEYYFGYINFYLLKNIEDSDPRFIKFKEFIDECMKNLPQLEIIDI
jgi:DNA-binding transcriptional LysR family regulator